ncbi:MAG: transposase [Deltaproteobacteria bacterium]|nr:MAG: transposase [Deltaproteobacteria bacterium]
MPRRARIDAPGALHHIICRGIEGQRVFRDDKDRDNLIKRLGKILENSSTPCYAWALIPSHFHLLLRTGNMPIARIMQRLLTGYAAYYNRRYQRHGHLFQNRYKSILCQEDTYLLELVRYIHLNPLRAKIVSSLEGLDRYRYCGHGRLIGRKRDQWQDTDTVLSLFGKRAGSARKLYRVFVEKGIAQGKRTELTGGGLVRSYGGWGALKSLRRMRAHLKGDERILGDSDFVMSVLKVAEENMERKYRLAASGYDFNKVLHQVSRVFNLKPAEILLPSKQRQRVRARSLLCFWAVKELGLSATSIAHKLGMTQPSVSRALQRGERLAADEGLTFDIDDRYA